MQASQIVGFDLVLLKPCLLIRVYCNTFLIFTHVFANFSTESIRLIIGDNNMHLITKLNNNFPSFMSEVTPDVNLTLQLHILNYVILYHGESS